MAPLWTLALLGLLFIPIDYRGGAETAHSHALLQLLLDAQDGHIQHTHALSEVPTAPVDWLDPVVPDGSADPAHAHPDLGRQQESAPALSVISFLVLVAIRPLIAGVLPRVTVETRRLTGRKPQVLSPPPRLATTGA